MLNKVENRIQVITLTTLDYTSFQSDSLFREAFKTISYLKKKSQNT